MGNGSKKIDYKIYKKNDYNIIILIILYQHDINY